MSDSAAAQSASAMDALRQFSGFCGVSLEFAVELADHLKRLAAERAYAELHIEMKRGKPFRLHVTQTTQFGEAS